MIRLSFATLGVAFFALGARAGAQSAEPTLHVAVDATRAAQRIYHVTETMPAPAGPFTFVYPKWIPGYHGPVGPIEEVVSLHARSGGNELTWRRDLVDFYAVHTTVPAGASQLEVSFDVVAAPSHDGQIAPVGSSQIALVEYSNLLVYPQGATAEGTRVDASLTLPPGWTFGTALPVGSQAGATVTFAPASLYTLVDSPIISGAHERAFALGDGHELDIASDSVAGTELTPKFLTGMKHLVREGPALYGGKHYRDYHFLLTLSDTIDPEGIEHHESSDNRASELYGAKDDAYEVFADLLPHEYSHSWNGKYRRPRDLATADYQAPELTDLLWVYEGLNQYNGEKLSTRARLNSYAIQLDELAQAAAQMDTESGRTWRPIRDTADGAPFLYESPGEFHGIRRGAGDFYTEGDLIWLDADVTIRRLTHGAKSLDDFCKLWGDGSDTTSVPRVRPYDRADVIALMTRVVAYDWDAFFKKRIDEVSTHAPLGGIEDGGYSLVYTDKPSTLTKGQAEQDKDAFDARYSIGTVLSGDGTVRDVLTTSPAFAAGIVPGSKLVAVDGKKYDADALQRALRDHKGRTEPLRLIVSNGDTFTVVDVDARAGLRYPHLVRKTGTDDVLAKIYAPKTFVAAPEAAETPAP